MSTQKIPSIWVHDGEEVKLTEMGFVTELLYMRNWNDGPRIRKLSVDTYICLDEFGNPVGNIKHFNHFENRADSVNSLRQTFRKMRNVINANVVAVDHVKFITLTYRQDDGEPMRDPDRLYRDFELFNKRFIYYCKKHNLGKYEYINVVEPQGSGAWHCHVLFFFEKKAPFLANDVIRDLWGQGWVTVRSLKNQVGKDCTNVGAYLTAYLGDLDLQGAVDARMDVTQFPLKEAEVLDPEGGKPQKKYYLKGARLYLYPPGMSIFRCSRGVKRPIETHMSYKDAKKKVSDSALTFQTNLSIHSDERSNSISKRYYNSAVEHSQEIIMGYRVDTATGEILENVDINKNDALLSVGSVLPLDNRLELMELDDTAFDMPPW